MTSKENINSSDQDVAFASWSHACHPRCNLEVGISFTWARTPGCLLKEISLKGVQGKQPWQYWMRNCLRYCANIYTDDDVFLIPCLVLTLAECDTSRCPVVSPCPTGYDTNTTKASGDCCTVSTCSTSRLTVAVYTRWELMT